MLDSLLSNVRIFIGYFYTSSKATTDQNEADILIKSILDIYKQVVALRRTKPHAEIEGLLAQIRQISIKPISEQVTFLVLNNPQIIEILGDLRCFCSETEGELEKEWSCKIAGAESSTEQEVYARLLAFPYLNTYANLIQAELSSMRSVETKPIEKIAFIGSGALPMTSLCLTGAIFDAPTNITVMNIDRNLEALELSKTLCSRLGSKAGKMEFLCAEAGSTLELSDYDAVYLAALVGVSQEEKEILLEQVTSKMTPGAFLITRGSKNLASLVYTTFDPTTEAVSKLLDVRVILHPQKYNIVNSVFIGQVKRRDDISLPI